MGRVIGRRGRLLKGFQVGEYKGFRPGYMGIPILIHRAVALAFLPPPPSPEHYQVAHCDGSRFNNRADNLRWATAVENSNDRVQHGTHLQGESIGNSRLTEDQALTIWFLRGADSSPRVAARYGVAPRTVRDIWNGKSWGWLTRA